ncbi:MAG: UDP-N-acetylmuramoylalanyl-D-glutamyl-2,6-diaminopimelate--D-alanyl-D-alanine ligase [Pseudolabrys sp.]
MSALWTIEAMAKAMNATRQGALPASISGISIDTRTVQPGDAFFAIVGDSRDGHDFVPAALKAGAIAVIAQDKRGLFPADAPLLIVDDVLDALRALGRAARARSKAKIVAVTGSVGKTGTKEALRLALAADGETHASAASYNNHWGVPLTLARFPETAAYGVFEIGMNHAGEITPLVQMVRPHVAIITTVAPVHLEYFGSVEAIADAKAEIFLGLEPGGVAVLNRDNPQYARLADAARRAKVSRIVTFGEDEAADARAQKICLRPDCSTVHATILGEEITYKLGAPGRHVVMNSLAVLAAVSLLEADLARAAMALAQLAPPTGRGARQTLTVPGGTALLIDESYNANPASMGAAIALLGQAPVGPRGRRIAVLGDMLELGPQGPALHAALAGPLAAASIDLVFCAGPLMRSLFDALPSGSRGGYAGTAAALESSILEGVAAGDAIMIKGSLGSKMGPIVKALAARFPAAEQDDAAAHG